MNRIRHLLLFALLSLALGGCIQSLSRAPAKDAGEPAVASQAVAEPQGQTATLPAEQAQDNNAGKQESNPVGVGNLYPIPAPPQPVAPRSATSQIDEAALAAADADAAEQPAENQKRPQTYLDEALDYVQVAQDFWQKGELENALEALDQAYSLILQVETYDDADLIQQKEDLRFMISKRILEIYASRNTVVNGDHREIPREVNRYVQAEIDLFTTGPERNFFMQSYKRSGRYRPQILQALREAGLPEELSWLPLIESGYKVKALSKARALGLWQFIPSTGYKFGLKRDMYIDERIDPEKSTAAAITYLKELHDIFGDWATVLAGYNCGEGRVLRVIRDQNINYLDNFWDLYERLPFETARYVPRFLATLQIVGNPEKYGLDKIELDPPVEYTSVTVTRQMQLKDAAKVMGIEASTLRELNPELRYGVLPPESYELKVPPGTEAVLLAKLDEIPVSSPPQRAFVYHRVRSGETLSTIAERYGTSVRSISVANNIRHRNFIRAGQKIKIPQRGMKVYPVSTAAASEPGRGPGRYVVKSGDSLWILANRFQTTVREIQDANNLHSTWLHIGQVLTIPGAGEVQADSGDRRTYRVRQGDSPYTIAHRYRMPLNKFLRLNNLTPRSTIYPGQLVYIE
ncbi:MAG: LysM peptidoglycan-binding domain-containing protein [Desulfobacterales bacterium]